MKWIAIDIGNSEIKVAVRGLGNNPTKLMYDDNGRLCSYLSSEVYITSDNKPYLGRYLPMLGTLCPEKIVEIKTTSLKNVVLNALFEKVKKAAAAHYEDTNIGAVLLYDNIVDCEISEIAKNYFSDVQNKCSPEVLSTILYMNVPNVLVVDISMSSLKVSLVEFGRKSAFFLSDGMGLASVDLSKIICYQPSDSLSDMELYMHGLLLEKTRMDLCRGNIPDFPIECLNIDNNCPDQIIDVFDNSMMRYLYKCFDVCTQDLRQLSKKWTDIDKVIFCGGASNYYKLGHVFENYLKGNGYSTIYQFIKLYNNDAQWAAAYAALHLPLIKKSGVVIDF